MHVVKWNTKRKFNFKDPTIKKLIFSINFLTNENFINS